MAQTPDQAAVIGVTTAHFVKLYETVGVTLRFSSISRAEVCLYVQNLPYLNFPDLGKSPVA